MIKAKKRELKKNKSVLEREWLEFLSWYLKICLIILKLKNNTFYL